MRLPTLAKVLEDQLKDLYSAKNQLVKALARMTKKASSRDLKAAIAGHLTETKQQVERLNNIGRSLGIKLTGKTCKAMEGLIEEGGEILKAEGPGPVIDAALIAAAQRLEHYEISAYGSARAVAEHAGHGEIVDLLQESLDEESAADLKLTALSTREILPAARSVEEAVST